MCVCVYILSFTIKIFLSCSWISIGTGVVSIIILLPCIFQEFNAVDKEHEYLAKHSRGKN